MSLRRAVVVIVVSASLLTIGMTCLVGVLIHLAPYNTESHAVQEVGRLSTLITITVVALGAIIAFLAWLLWHVNRHVLSRLEDLRRGAERATADDQQVLLGDQQQDEIGGLSRTFERMLIELRASRERVSEEAARRAGEERQRQLIDALPDLVWTAQPDGSIDTSNRSWREQFATTPDVPGYDWTELMNATDLALWKTAWTTALINGAGFELEIRLRGRHGPHWYLTRVAPLANGQGRVLGWVCKAEDIYHRKELESHLRNSRNQAALLNQIGLDLVGEMDFDKLIQRVTNAARALVEAEFTVLFYNVGELKGADSELRYAVSGIEKAAFASFGLPPAAELFHPVFNGSNVVRCDDVQKDPRFFPNAPSQGPLVGHSPVVSYLAVPIRTRFGVVIGGLFCGHSEPAQFTVPHERLLLGIAALVATAFDSARLMEAERRLRRLSDQRAGELARSNAELEQFAYICSHDLQEPLRMVTSFLGLLEERYQTVLDERGRVFVRRAIEGSSRMQNLVRDILSYSRVGRGERAEEIMSLDEVLDEALSNVQTAVDLSRARIDRGPMPTVRANRLQCVQLFQNLLSNALKFRGEEASPVISIAATKEDSRWRLTITDNGIGIDPVQHKRIFQVFQRLHGRDQYEGTGIGLSLCQKIVLAHDGTIGVESQLGQGATFWFTLPEALEHDTPQSGKHAVIMIPKEGAA